MAGVHVPGVLTPPPRDRALSEEGKAYLARQERFRNLEGGYAHQQGTYPQTLAYGLTDSPAGLAAWIVDKFRAWSDCEGDVERRFTKDELLTHVTLFWITGSINSSFLFYYVPRGAKARIGTPGLIAPIPRFKIRLVGRGSRPGTSDRSRGSEARAPR